MSDYRPTEEQIAAGNDRLHRLIRDTAAGFSHLITRFILKDDALETQEEFDIYATFVPDPKGSRLFLPVRRLEEGYIQFFDGRSPHKWACGARFALGHGEHTVRVIASQDPARPGMCINLPTDPDALSWIDWYRSPVA